MSPRIAPPLAFGLPEAQQSHDAAGFNCGPGALAGTCGLSPHEALALMPDFSTYRHTREWMLESALDALGIHWEHQDPEMMSYGIARILWGGPWEGSGNRFDRLAHSHWVGVTRSPGSGTWFFDINAIAHGGWLAFEEWEGHLVPWLMEREEPDWNGAWTFGEGYAFDPPTKAPGIHRPRMPSERMRSLDIREEEHPYLHSHPMVCGGRVVIRHSRISTTAVAGRIDGDSMEELLGDYPDLSPAMVKAALAHGRRQLALMPR